MLVAPKRRYGRIFCRADCHRCGDHLLQGVGEKRQGVRRTESALKAHVKKTGGDYEVTLEETGVAAFKGQQVSADALKGIVDAAVNAALAGVGAVVLP